MSDYVTLPDDKKLELLNEHSIAGPWPSLDHTMWCLHCEKEFTGHDVRMHQDKEGGLWLQCRTPDCDGSPIDWAPYPWWDSEHPLTKAQHQGEEGDDDETAPTVQ